MDAEHRKDRRAVVVALVVGTPISAVLLWLAFRSADLEDVWSTLRDAEPLDVVLALCAMAAVYLIQAARWRAIARVWPPTYVGYAELVVSGVACNNLLPGRLGDILRARWLALDSHLWERAEEEDRSQSRARISYFSLSRYSSLPGRTATCSNSS